MTPTPTEAPDDSNNSNTDNPDPTTAPSDNNGNSSNNNPSSDDPTNSTIQTAEKYIGMSIDDLVGAVGIPSLPNMMMTLLPEQLDITIIRISQFPHL